MGLTSDYVIDENVLIRAVLESTYGTDPGSGYETIPVYRQFIPHQIAADVIDLGQSSVGSNPSAVGQARFRHEIAYEVWAYGTGTASTPPPWAKYLLKAAGFNESVIDSTTPPDLSGASTAATESSTGAGTIPNGTYKYKMTFVDDDSTAATYRDESADSDEITGTVSSGPSNITLSDLPTIASDTLLRIYRTVAGGSVHYFVDEVVSGTTSYVDTKTDYELDRSRVIPTATADKIVYTPLKDTHDALTVHPYFMGHRRKANGCRFTMDWNWVAGEPGSITFNGRGIYNAADDIDISALNFVEPGIPPNFCSGVAPFLIPSADSTWYDNLGSGSAGSSSAAAISPFSLKMFSGTMGRDPILRTDASATCSVKEFYLGRPNARVRMTVEVQRNFKWDPVEDCRLGVTYNAGGFVIGPATNATHKRVGMGFPKLSYASVPQLVTENEQLKCWSLEFIPLQYENEGDWMHIYIY